MKAENGFGMRSTILVCSVLVILMGCNRSEDVATGTSPSDSTTVGAVVDDTVTTAKVKAALMADSSVAATDVQVETKNGEVMLSGFVENKSQIEQSEAIARSVEGVRSVNNMLALKSGSSTIGSNVDDSVVTAKVKSALLGAEDLKSMDISVETNKGDVQLNGFVDSETQKNRAVEIAQGIDGVKSVKDQLTVKK